MVFSGHECCVSSVVVAVGLGMLRGAQAAVGAELVGSGQRGFSSVSVVRFFSDGAIQIMNYLSYGAC